jgi:uncharacterized repeat protein (TIGR01451 family)
MKYKGLIIKFLYSNRATSRRACARPARSRARAGRTAVGLLALQLVASAGFAATPDSEGAAQDPRLSVKAIAEVEVNAVEHGRETVKLVPADRVVPGDEVIYTVEIRNKGAVALPPPRVDYPIPEHMRYLEATATGPGAEVRFSVDGGHTFDRPENLTVVGSDGRKHPASAADYTHIRWQLKHILKGNSVAYARFRAVVK